MKKTIEFNEKLQKHVGGSINFSLDAPKFLINEQDENSIFNAETGEVNELKLVTNLHQSLGKRNRKVKVDYSESAYYKDILFMSEQKSLLPRVRKKLSLYPWQFVNIKRLKELEQIESSYHEKYKYDYEHQQKTGRLSNLSVTEEAERQQLINQGFVHWKYSDYRVYLNALTTYGRLQKEKIIAMVLKQRPKLQAKDIEKYHETFLSKMTELKDYHKIMKQITKVELAMEKTLDYKHGLTELISPYADKAQVYQQLKIIPSKTLINKGYSQYDDALLLYHTNKVGYGNWTDVVEHIKQSNDFSFNYFIRSQTVTNLARRIESNVRSNMPKKPKNNKRKNNDSTISIKIGDGKSIKQLKILDMLHKTDKPAVK